MTVQYRTLTIEEAEAKRLSDEELVRRLLAAGASRLTAERIVAIERGADDVRRARRHTRGR